MKNTRRIDLIITFVPMLVIITLSLFFIVFPNESNEILSTIRYFLGNTLGSYYLIIGIIFFAAALYLAFSKYGSIKLGKDFEKPKYSFFSWGCMMFTCGLAADILFYSFSEWIMYVSNPYVESLGNPYEWAGVFPVFHWSFIPWAFYLVLAVAFGYMLHVKKVKKQRFSEACKPLIKKGSNGIFGRIIDLLSVFALLAGTATTFSIATPLMTRIISNLFNVNVDDKLITIMILIITCFVYTFSLLKGFKGINKLANICITLFFLLIVYIFIFGGQAKFIIDSGLESIGKLIQNFIGLATYTDPLRETGFPQDWTIYYWAYWMVWCVAAPFFIGNISKGRTIKQVIIGGFCFGVGSTIVSFIILGNYSLSLQSKGIVDFVSMYVSGVDLYTIIINVINTIPYSNIIMAIILVTMILFYATSFDSIAFTASCYSYKSLGEEEKPHKTIQFLWCILLIILPIALVFSESSMNNLQSVSIIAAFPLGITMLIILYCLLKQLKNDLK